VADNKLSAREAALIAQARADLAKKPAAGAAPQPRPPPQTSGQPGAAAAPERTRAAAPVVRALQAAPAPAAERAAALMAAARDETEHLRQRRKALYLWVPVAFISATGLWTLFWMWHKL
jgi:hypothetical protein